MATSFRRAKLPNTEFQNRLLRKLYSEREADDPTFDFVVSVDVRRFPVHRLIIGTGSGFFSEIFKKDPEKFKYELRGVKAEDLISLLDFMYGKAIVLSEMKMSRVLELLALSDKLLSEGFIEHCKKYARTWPDRIEVGQFYSLLCALELFDEMKAMEGFVLRHFVPDGSEDELPLLKQVTPELLAAALKREDLTKGMSMKALKRKQTVLFSWFRHNDYGRFEDLAERLEEVSPFQVIKRQMILWLGAAQKEFLHLQVSVCRNEESGSKYKVELFQCELGSDVWSRRILETDFPCNLCSVQDGKILFAEWRKYGEEHLLRILDGDTKVQSMPLPKGFDPFLVCVIGQVVFVLGLRNGSDWWLCRIDSADESMQEKDMKMNYGGYCPAMTSSGGDFFVLCEDQLMRFEGGSLTSVRLLFRFAETCPWPIIALKGRILTVFSEHVHLTLDLVSLNATPLVKNSKSDLRTLPVEGDVFACFQFEDGLALAMEPQEGKKGVRLFRYKPSMNQKQERASFKPLGVLPVPPPESFKWLDYYFRGSLIR